MRIDIYDRKGETQILVPGGLCGIGIIQDALETNGVKIKKYSGTCLNDVIIVEKLTDKQKKSILSLNKK